MLLQFLVGNTFLQEIKQLLFDPLHQIYFDLDLGTLHHSFSQWLASQFQNFTKWIGKLEIYLNFLVGFIENLVNTFWNFDSVFYV